MTIGEFTYKLIKYISIVPAILFKIIAFPIVAPIVIIIISLQAKDYEEFKEDLREIWLDYRG